MQQSLIGARKVHVAGTVSLWFLVILTGESADKIIYLLLPKQEQNLTFSRAPVLITGFCFNWIGKRKHDQCTLCEAGELGKQSHNSSV